MTTAMSPTPECGKKPAQLLEAEAPSDSEIARLLPGFLHSLNNPLCAVTNSIALLEKDVADEPDYLKDVQELRQTTDRLMQMMAAMQLFVRGGVNGISRLPADQLLELAVRLVRPLYHSKGGQILLAMNGALARLSQEQASHFLRGMVFLLMDTLEIMSAPPTLAIEAAIVENGPNRTLRFGFSCSTDIELQEIQRRCNRCMTLFEALGGHLSIKSDPIGQVRLDGQVSIHTGDVLLD